MKTRRNPHCSNRPLHGFSLVEVVVATGIVAIAVAAVIGVLPALARQATESAEALVAQQLAEPFRIELDRVARAQGLDALAGSVPVLSGAGSAGFACVAARDGSGLRRVSEHLGVEESFYLIEAWRFGEAPLAYEPGRPVLAVLVRVSWPYRLPGGTASTPSTHRKHVVFTAAINR